MKKNNKKLYLILSIGLILAVATFLRFHNLVECGFKFCDEGYHLLNPTRMKTFPPYSMLGFKHGLMVWIYVGLSIFGFSSGGALIWSALCGLANIALFYPLCRQFVKAKNSLIATGLFSVCYYILYYNRSNLSDGYALLFFTVILTLLIFTYQSFDLSKAVFPVIEKHSRYLQYPLLIITGLLIGYSFTIRIQTCMTLLGFAGAFGITVLLTAQREKRLKDFIAYTAVTATILIFAIIGYAAFMASLGEWVNWQSTIKWYGKNLTIANNQTAISWKPFIIYHLSKLCGIPLLVIGIAGFFADAISFKKLNVYRKWLIISFVGLLIMFFKTAMPWPRGHLYAVFFLIIYWGIALEYISKLITDNKRKKIITLITALIIIASFVGELILDYQLINKRANLNSAESYMLITEMLEGKRDKRNIISTHMWPTLMEHKWGSKSLIVYQDKFRDYDHLCFSLINALKTRDTRFMILEHNNSFFGQEDTRKLLQQFVLTNPPQAFFINDFGEDYHTCMETFGRPPVHDIFSNRVMVYDLEKMKNFAYPPEPYTNNKDMTDKFEKKLEKIVNSLNRKLENAK